MARKNKASSRGREPKPSRIEAPGYGFPKGRKGLLPWSWAEQRLKKSHNYWITTVTPGKPSKPHSMVIWGLWQEGRFLFITGAESRKTRNLAKNTNCIVSTEDASEAVVLEGVAESTEEAPSSKLASVVGLK